MSRHGVVVDEGHEIPFRGVWKSRYVGSINEKFWFEESLILVVVFPLIRIWWA